jgi:hypothetical protein
VVSSIDVAPATFCPTAGERRRYKKTVTGKSNNARICTIEAAHATPLMELGAEESFVMRPMISATSTTSVVPAAVQAIQVTLSLTGVQRRSSYVIVIAWMMVSISQKIK